MKLFHKKVEGSKMRRNPGHFLVILHNNIYFLLDFDLVYFTNEVKLNVKS